MLRDFDRKEKIILIVENDKILIRILFDYG